MQWVRNCVCILVLVVLMYETVQASAPQLLYRYYDRSRSTRGIKNGLLNSARGFGKRSLNTGEQTRMPVDWMADEISSSPELARILVRQFIDLDRDGYLSPYELLSRPATVNDKQTADNN
ncbi:Hypothetical protein NTJ_09529 [Nesidiocoris tenuis]|uniref:EF-hand domain-containing protein n=1 Tax=Nesidiocoris tenuis TaxID=355587 RepID=A0ABN7AWZ4_9HEMI|nr:Hypothetical protein NTJ_09529 [Nesidiocoris tenuis]